MSDVPMNERRGRRQTWLVCLLLTAVVLAAYGRALNNGFVRYDDPDYITANPHIREGLSRPVVSWAFRSGYASNWHPLTWLSHALDVQLFGLKPAGHHAVNIIFHLANSILLFLVLKRLTGAPWRSAAVAALFAAHPLHVESVAWVSERKDVLSTFFWMLTVAAYARYASGREAKRKTFYGLALFCFACGLMSKPMVVTLPFILLLLDYWPLRRQTLGMKRLLLEKAPFVGLSVISSVVTYIVQKQAGSVSSLAKLPLGARFANMPVAYFRYLAKTFWPSHLAVFYPYPPYWPLWQVLAASLLLLLVTVWVVTRRQTQPYLLVGWFWFLGALIPVIGLIQAGDQSMADRYSYVPTIGLFIATVWAAREWLGSNRITALFACLVIVACTGLTARQVGYWKDSTTLFAHAARVVPKNFVALYNLGCEVQEAGQTTRAMDYFREALEAKPPYPRAHNNLGFLLLATGKPGPAIVQFEQALAYLPQYPEAYYNLGRAYLTNGQPKKAIACLQKARELDPSVPTIPNMLAGVLRQQGMLPQAIAEYERAIDLRPDFAPPLNTLAWLLATCPAPLIRDGPLALALAQHAVQLSGARDPAILDTLSAAAAEAGKFPQAIAAAQHARPLAAAQGNLALVERIDQQLQQYQKGLPWRDQTQKIKAADDP